MEPSAIFRNRTFSAAPRFSKPSAMLAGMETAAGRSGAPVPTCPVRETKRMAAYEMSYFWNSLLSTIGATRAVLKSRSKRFPRLSLPNAFSNPQISANLFRYITANRRALLKTFDRLEARCGTNVSMSRRVPIKLTTLVFRQAAVRPRNRRILALSFCATCWKQRRQPSGASSWRVAADTRCGSGLS
jgi:hypothetical protein